MKMEPYREAFPAFFQEEPLIYLDSAATTLRPKIVAEKLKDYSLYGHANIHRGAYKRSYEATEAYDKVRKQVATFIGAKDPEEIVFTYGATDGLNLLMRSFSEVLQEGDVVVVSIFEHHSNLVPWQQLCRLTGAKLKFLYDFNEENLLVIDEKTKIVAVTMMSNAIGVKIPVDKVIKKAHKVGAKVVLDGAQYAGHKSIDVQRLDADFLVFSGHKMFASTGIGVLYGKKEALSQLAPYRYGGDMIEYVYEDKAVFSDVPNRFEAGTPNIEGVMGLGFAIDYIEEVGIDAMERYLEQLRTYAREQMEKMEHVHLIEPVGYDFGPVLSFVVDDVHPHDVASILDASHIAIRAGHHCAQPLMRYLNIQSTCRISFQIYNTKEDIDYFVTKLKTVRRWLGYES